MIRIADKLFKLSYPYVDNLNPTALSSFFKYLRERRQLTDSQEPVNIFVAKLQ
jgi:hypothetical protein